MEFEGKVLEMLPPQSGESARGKWQRQDVIFELQQVFSRRVCARFFNKESEVQKLRVGGIYTVSFNLESREFNGRWYTDVNVWRVQSHDQPQQPAAPAYDAPMPDSTPFGEPAAPAGTSAQEVDDLPF